jgi:hypothetical protein
VIFRDEEEPERAIAMNLASAGVSLGGPASSADLVGSSKYSNEVYYLLL